MSALSTVKLPEKASDLIALALHDLLLCERDKTHVVNMGQWHSARYGAARKCAVCFAGAVMAKTCGVAPEVNRLPFDFTHRTAKKLKALDDFRESHITVALRGGFHIDVDLRVRIHREYRRAMERDVSYEYNRLAWLKNMRLLVRILRKHDL